MSKSLNPGKVGFPDSLPQELLIHSRLLSFGPERNDLLTANVASQHWNSETRHLWVLKSGAFPPSRREMMEVPSEKLVT